jgi:hypothetical protein
MNKGIEILLARMESNPEEFIFDASYGESKWSAIVSYFKNYLDAEDIKTLMDAWQENTRKVMQERFTQEVMKELLDPKSLELEDVIKQYRATGISSIGQTLAPSMAQSKAMVTGATLATNSNTLTIGNQTLDQETIEHMKAHLDYIRKQEVQEAKKKATPR